jgi:hypothetical protein
MYKILRKGAKFVSFFGKFHLLCQFLLLCYYMLEDSADTISRELWWTNQEFGPSDIAPPWLSILIFYN